MLKFPWKTRRYPCSGKWICKKAKQVVRCRLITRNRVSATWQRQLPTDSVGSTSGAASLGSLRASQGPWNQCRAADSGFFGWTQNTSERELTEPGTILKTTISHVFILPAIRLTELQSQKWKSYCFGQSLNAPPLFKAGTRYVLCFKEKGKPKLNLRFYKRHKTWEYNYFLKYIMYLCAKLLGPKPAFFTLWLWILIDVTLEFHTILN